MLNEEAVVYGHGGGKIVSRADVAVGRSATARALIVLLIVHYLGSESPLPAIDHCTATRYRLYM